MNGLRIILADADPAGLPAELWLLKFLLVFTFVLHLLFVNVVVGGGIVWLWAGWRTRRAPHYATLARFVGRVLPVATAFAITTGVAPLLFTQLVYGQLFYTSSVLMAWPWLAIVGLVLGGYYANYGISFSDSVTRRSRWYGAASVVLFVAVAWLFTNNMTLMLRPEMHAPMYLASDAGLHTNAADVWVWPRVGHMVVGAVAFMGLVVAWMAKATREPDAARREAVLRFGTRLFRVATFVELAAGIALFLALPRPVKEVFLAGRTPDALLLVAGVAFAMAAVAVVRRSLVVGSAALVVALVDMAVVRHRVRALLLEPYFQPESLGVTPQTAVFLLFAALLVAGLGVVAWMIVRFVRGGADATNPLVSV